MQFKSFIILCLVWGIITILCQAGAYTPVARIPVAYAGGASTNAIVSDTEGITSTPVSLSAKARAVNEAPVITGQTLYPIAMAEDNSLAIDFGHLLISDADNTYPEGFTLSVSEGENYTVSGTTITPHPNFTGTLIVPVTVNDGVDNSAPFNLQITVDPVNDAPQITAQQSLSISEEQPFTLVPEHLVVTDPDNTVFSLLVYEGANYTLSGNTVTPVPDFSGVLTVLVQVSDGALTSDTYALQVAVEAINDTPVITGQLALSTPQNTPVTIQFGHLTVTDADNSYPTGFNMTIYEGTAYTVSGTTVIPATEFSGTLNVSLTVSDGVNSSAPFNFQLQVTDVNDPPVITGQAALRTNEEQPLTIDLLHLAVSDPDNPYPAGFALLVSAGSNFTLSDNTVIPNSNFAGSLTVPVRVNDGVNTSAIYNLTITVDPVNDPPSFSAIANQTVPENAGARSVAITNITKGPGEDDQQLTFIATSANASVIPDPTISYTPGSATATLTYTTLPDISGLVTITVVAVDNGSNVAPSVNTYSVSFQVQVAEINSAPTLDASGNHVVPEDAVQQSIGLTGISAGAGESQVLTVEVFTDKPALFEVLQVAYTSGMNTANLLVKPAANVYGAATITVKVTDNGSSVSPSVNAISRAFLLTIQAVNDMPVFITMPPLLAAVNEPYEYLAVITDVENATLPFSLSVGPPWLSLAGAGNGKALVRGTPSPSAAGSPAVSIVVTDGALRATQQYTLLVNNRPVASPFRVSVTEDGAYTFSAQPFEQAFADADHHTLAAVLITQKPAFGKLRLDKRELNGNDTIALASLPSLVYEPVLNYAGADSFSWKAGDGYHFSAAPVPVNISVLPVNDAPVIILESDSLQYEVNGEPAVLSRLLDIEDPDDDSLVQAEVGFRPQNFYPEFDMLLYESKSAVKATYDFQSGKLTMAGKAPVAEYRRILRSIQYTHLNTLDPELRLKSVFLTATDGKAWGERVDRTIRLKYTFIDLEIPTGFTPNGDNANDTWVISRPGPGGVEQLDEAVIKVFNKRGVQVFYAEGFGNSWDGTMNGETLPADTYFFTIDLNLRNKKRYKGAVTILR